MEFRERWLYHQGHPVKLMTDIGVTFPFLYFMWQHRVAPALAILLVPPIVVSLTMICGRTDLERIKHSGFGRYLRQYMTPVIETLRLLTLFPMAYGARQHKGGYVVLGFIVLAAIWGHGLVVERRALP